MAQIRQQLFCTRQWLAVLELDEHFFLPFSSPSFARDGQIGPTVKHVAMRRAWDAHHLDANRSRQSRSIIFAEEFVHATGDYVFGVD